MFAYNRNSYFAANNFFNNRSGIIRPFRNRNQFGGKLSGRLPIPNFGEGGPMFKDDKAFFFFAYEGIRDPLSNLRTRTILTPSARSGAFTFNRASAGNPINSGGISCPSGASGSVCTVSNLLQFANTLGFANIPLTIDPVVQSRVINQLPTTSNFTGGDGLNTAGFALTRAGNTERNTYTSRIDFDATDKDSFNGVFSFVKNQTLRNDSENNKFTVIPAVDQASINKTFVLAYRRIFSETIVNEVRGGVFESEVPFIRTDPLPPFFFNTANSTLVASLVTFPEATFMTQGRKNRSYNFQDNVDWVVGKHSLRFGGQLQYFQVNSFNEGGIVPSYRLGTGPNTPSFSAGNFANNCTPSPCASGQTSLISTTQLGTANNLLALFGGIVNAGTQTFNADSVTSPFLPQSSILPYRYANHSLYFMDRWSVARGLTLTLGMRYEVYPALRLANGLTLEPVITNPDNFAADLLNPNGRFQIVGGNAGKENAYYRTDYNNFAPSIGVAYTPNFESGFGKFLFGSEGKTVLRGGYSQSYGNDSILTALDGQTELNVGLGSTASSAISGGSNNLNDRLSGTLTPIIAPVFTGAPTYLQNNAPGIGNNIGNISAVDPNLQIPKIEQYSFGIQREFFGNLALEVRYVGSRSESLLRAIDYNQIDIFNNGILSDFNRALANDRLTGNPFCVSAGCVPLQIFREGPGIAGRLGVAPTTATTPAGTLARATFLNNLRNGAVADLARLYVSGGINNHPTVASPTRVPFVN
ncbi:MAG: TonB-dependent receptor, partial [Blastocatellia bacterium]|nr:TonB-dependent receptor [Blastocatellia bacterium]